MLSFSARLQIRARLWWGKPNKWRNRDSYRNLLHRLKENHTLRHRSDPDARWRCCDLWQRTLSNKWNAREFVQRYGCRVPIQTPRNGAPISWKREDGEPSTVSVAWDGAAFEQTFVSGSGRRINRYSVSADGQTLTIHVAVTGGGLPDAMTYQLVYRRVAPDRPAPSVAFAPEKSQQRQEQVDEVQVQR